MKRTGVGLFSQSWAISDNAQEFVVKGLGFSLGRRLDFQKLRNCEVQGARL